MAENTSFADAARVVYRWLEGIEILPDSKIMGYNPRKLPELAVIMSFADPARVVYRGVTGHQNPPGTRKSWVLTHENSQNWPKSLVLPIPVESCTEVTGHRNPRETRKSWVIAHENDQKWTKTRVLQIPLESCTGGHTTSNASRDSKIMGYNPRKRPEIAENTNFADLSRVVY